MSSTAGAGPDQNAAGGAAPDTTPDVDLAATPDTTPDTAPQTTPADLPSVQDLPGGSRAAIEAILAVADDAVTPGRVAAALGLSTEAVRDQFLDLAARYREEHRGYELREVAGAWRLYSNPDFGAYVEAFVRDGQSARLTQASLETLAVIAYRQPVTRGRIAAVRGVNVDGVVRTLVARGLVEEAGRDGEGGAIRYRTTSHFLERMGLGSLAELPPLAPYLPDLDDLDEGELQ